MSDFTLEELRKKAQAKKGYLQKKHKEGYAYARSKGFSSYEASVLQAKSKEFVDKLVADREQNKSEE